MKIYNRIMNGIKIGIWAIKNPNILTGNCLEVSSKLLALLMQVATEDRPYVTDIVVTIDKDVEQPIIHIWAGNGASAEPFKRIKELAEENESLKEMVKINKCLNCYTEKLECTN